jgi:hypothetical protein
MKTFKLISLMLIFFLFLSCGSTMKFPISDITPAADIIVKKKQDKNGNLMILVSARNLAAVERLNPSKNAYVVWVVTDNSEVRNIGQLKNLNVQTTSLESIVPFMFWEIFITAEDYADALYPSGTEISRVRFSK